MGNIKIGIRLLLIAVIAAVGLVAVEVEALSNQGRTLMADRQVVARSLVQAAEHIVEALHERVGRGELSEAEAKARALTAVQAMQYGNGDYLVILSGRGTTLAHPKPAMVGREMNDVHDPDGVYFTRELIAAAKKGGGFVSYRFPRAGATELSPKLSYAMEFKPWDWVVVTGIYVDDVDVAVWEQVKRGAVVVFLVLAMVVGASVAIARGVSRPLGVITTAITRLTKGERVGEIPFTQRKDEVGVLARACATFAQNAEEMGRLRLQQEEDKRHAEAERHRATLDIANRFEASVAVIVSTVRDQTIRLRSSAGTMTEVAGQTGEHAQQVAGGSQEVSANVETVASATEELAASTLEIGRQINDASLTAQKAASEASSTQATVKGLAVAAQKIGEVVHLISAIASQTNLLALNATIEAARAGEAGKGFAVVAGEVKTLANQTARATEEISRQVTDIQASSGHVSVAIEGMARTIERINQTSSAIAAAVEEQGAAAREISRNVDGAARYTQEVSANIAGVRDGAIATGDSAREVLHAADGLSAQVDGLHQEVGAFLARVRAG